MRKTGGKSVIILYLFMWLHQAEQHLLSRWKWTTRWSNGTHVTTDPRSRHKLNPRPTRFLSGKTNECRWRPRPYQVDPWSRSREVARGILHSSPKSGKGPICLQPEKDQQFVPSVFHPPPEDKCFCIQGLAGAHLVLPAVWWTLCDQGLGQSP